MSDKRLTTLDLAFKSVQSDEKLLFGDESDDDAGEDPSGEVVINTICSFWLILTESISTASFCFY